jgi:hypothetical protein
MRKILALLFGLALFVPLAACGGGDDDETSSGSGSSSASSDEDDDESTTTTEEEDDDSGDSDSDGGANADSEYCGVVQDVIDLDDAFGDEELDFADDETVAIVVNALEDLRDSVDDDDIADDYDTAIDGFEAIADAVRDAGGDEDAELEVFTDPDFEDQFTEFTAATERIDEFTLEECGTTLDGSTETDDSSDSSSSSSGEDTSLEDFADDVEGCEDGDMAVCDELFAETPVGSEAEAVSHECGGEDPGGFHTGDCEEVFG